MSNIISIKSHPSFCSPKEIKAFEEYSLRCERKILSELDVIYVQLLFLSDCLGDDLDLVKEARNSSHEARKNIIKAIQPRLEVYKTVAAVR